jgi:hypothetical protein
MPQRIQLSRKRGWRKPENTVVVARPGKWGNPYKPTDYKFQNADGSPAQWDESAAREMALRDFEHAIGIGLLKFKADDVRRELRGKDLACWCPLNLGCHADVLLRIANGDVTKPNPITAFLRRAAEQAGTPEKLRREIETVKDLNTRKLLLRFVAEWEEELRLRGKGVA